MRFNNYDEKNQCPFCDHFNLGFFIHFEMFLSRLVNPVQNYWWPFSSVFQARNCEWCCFNLSYRFSIFSFYLLLAQVWICFASDQANDTTSSSNCCSQPEISRLNSQLAFTSDFPETLVVLLVLINYSQTYIFYTYILGLPSFIRPVNGEWLWWWTYTQYVLISKGPISKTSQISGFSKQWLVKFSLLSNNLFCSRFLSNPLCSQFFQLKQK